MLPNSDTTFSHDGDLVRVHTAHAHRGKLMSHYSHTQRKVRQGMDKRSVWISWKMKIQVQNFGKGIICITSLSVLYNVIYVESTSFKQILSIQILSDNWHLLQFLHSLWTVQLSGNNAQNNIKANELSNLKALFSSSRAQLLIQGTKLSNWIWIINSID